MQAGFAHVDITPQLNDRPHGSYRPRVMVGVHDRLLASACVIENDATIVALVGIDAGVIVRETFLRACDAIAHEIGIPAGNVIVSASHTHTGGPSLSTFAAVADPAYAPIVARGISDAVVRAFANRAPAQCAEGSAAVSGIHFNRRFLMRDGRQVTHPGKLHPDIVAPAGPIDDKLRILALRTPAGALGGIVVSFGCHNTVTEDHNEYSADYVHYLREHLKRIFGPIEIVFLLGACGDVTQIDNRAPLGEKGHAHAEMMGRVLAEHVRYALERAKFDLAPDIAVANETTQIAIRERDVAPPPGLGLGSGDYWEPIYAAEAPLVAQMRAAEPIRDCHVPAIRLGELAIVANGAELFAQPALDIQRASPFKRTWTVTLANEYLGYVPTAAAHYAGGYEPRLARSSFLAPEAAQQIVEASLRALKGVRP